MFHTANNYIRIRVEKDPSVKFKKYYLNKIDSIEKEISRTHELSMQLQKFGQRLTDERQETFLNQVVKNTVKLMDSVLKKNKMNLELRLSSSLDKPIIKNEKNVVGNPIYLDEGQIEQVIINLILNAIEASQPKNRMLVETRLY